MTINKALEHFEWKFKNSWKPTSKDVEAYNAIIDYKQLKESRNLSEHESLAKLFIHQLILLSRTNMYNGERCIQIIDEILNKSVYDWCVILQNEIPMMRFNSIPMGIYQIDSETLLNRTKLSQINKEIVYNYETELTEALKYKISEENIIKFVQKEVNRIINKYEK